LTRRDISYEPGLPGGLVGWGVRRCSSPRPGTSVGARGPDVGATVNADTPVGVGVGAAGGGVVRLVRRLAGVVVAVLGAGVLLAGRSWPACTPGSGQPGRLTGRLPTSPAAKRPSPATSTTPTAAPTRVSRRRRRPDLSHEDRLGVAATPAYHECTLPTLARPTVATPRRPASGAPRRPA